MASVQPVRHTIRFGQYEADPRIGELRKDGMKLRIREQPFQVLLALLEKPGELVTREELHEKLWSDQTFVDFDQGLNTAIAKIREALNDSASDPRFVETIPRRGYRFIAPVERPGPVVLPMKPAPPEPAPARKPWWRDPRVAAATLLALAAGLLIRLWILSPVPPAELPTRRFTITPEEPVSFAAISPDGAKIAYVTGASVPSLWIHDLNQGQARKAEDTDGVVKPFWSPDSELIGFAADNQLKTQAVADSSVTVVCPLPGGSQHFLSGAWSHDASSIIFAQGSQFSLFQVPALGGTAKLLAESEKTSPRMGWSAPSLLPPEAGGSTVLCAFGSIEKPYVIVQNLETGEQKQVIPGLWPVYSSTGHVLYQAMPRGSLLIEAVPFSAKDLSVTGEPFPVARDARYPSLAADGTLVYLAGRNPMQQLVWLDRTGARLAQVGELQGNIAWPELSPDGRRVAVSVDGENNRDIWILDIERSVKMLLTPSSPLLDHRPLWSPGGDYIAYTATRKGFSRDVVLRRADGTGEPETLLGNESTEHPTDWSRDGEYLLYQSYPPGNKSDINYLARKVDGSFGEPTPFVQSPFMERVAKFSPDNSHVVYCSDESGSDEVYVQRFPEGGGRVKISRNGGKQPRWSRDGTEIFYVEGDTLMTVSVSLSPRFSASAPEPLFRHSGLAKPEPEQMYDVSADGQRFLVVETLGKLAEPPVIHVVQNWFAGFRDSAQ